MEITREGNLKELFDELVKRKRLYNGEDVFFHWIDIKDALDLIRMAEEKGFNRGLYNLTMELLKDKEDSHG